uniref:stomatin-like protein 1 isoform X1 n=2 Tax=Podarcis muralis TaxID=64176 RepID=UPI00109FD7E3|nr:stomatin-like protein 1 isoform X1 [Podarcis muralis]XP_028599501.1 stomatin-like protein 1 isoform X1 [Podarcis muralis]
MFSRSGYQALPLGDTDQYQQSGNWPDEPREAFFPPGRTWNTLKLMQKGTDPPQECLSWVCHGVVTTFVLLVTVLLFPISAWFVLKIVPTYERMIMFRLGRIRAPQGPGVVLVLPFIDHWQLVDLRTRAFSIPPCKLTSRDGAWVSVGADVQFRVWDPLLSVMMVKDLNIATRMTAQNAMTKIVLKKYLQEIQTEKLRIADQLLVEINDITRSWGLEVDRVELILGSVLQASQETVPQAPGSRPPIPGLEGLDSTIQQLALQFFGKTLAAAATRPNGDFETAEHVEVENETEEPPHAVHTEPGGSSEGRRFKAEEHLSALERCLSESLVNQVKACYQINVRLASGAETTTYFIDLSSGRGRIGPGLPDHSPDVVLEVSESDLEAFILGELHPLNAYVCGRLQVHGDLNVALKLEELFKVMKQRR